MSKHHLRLCQLPVLLVCLVLSDFSVCADTSHVTKSPNEVLLVFAVDGRKAEAEAAEAACRKYNVPFDARTALDSRSRDYSQFQAVILGSNILSDWRGSDPSPEAFAPLDAFIKQGGHLIVFGTWNGVGMQDLRRYGVSTAAMHSSTFDTVPGNTAMFFQDNESLVPRDRRLRCTGSIECSQPYSVLLRRGKGGVGPQHLPGQPAMITLSHGKGRLTVCMAEPFWVEPKEDVRQATWLISATVSWLSRGCPTAEDGATAGKGGNPAPVVGASQSSPSASVQSPSAKADDFSLEAAIQREQELLSTTRPATPATIPTPPQPSTPNAATEAQAEITRLEKAIEDENKSFDAVLAKLTTEIAGKQADMRQAKTDKERSAIQDELMALGTRKFNLAGEHKKRVAALHQELDGARLATVPSDPRITPAMIAEYRGRLQTDAQAKITAMTSPMQRRNDERGDASLRDQLKTMGTNRSMAEFRQSLQQQLNERQERRAAELKQAKDVLEAANTASDREVALWLTDLLKKQDAADAQRRAREQQQEQAAKDAAAARRAEWKQKYQNWDGPTTVCRDCGGVGRTALSSRQTMQNVSPDIGMMAGSGMSRSIPNSTTERCSRCVGVGRVPENGR